MNFTDCTDEDRPQALGWLGPEVRLIVSLRSPAQRAFSHYQHNWARLPESRSFEEALAANVAAPAAGMDLPGAYRERGEYAPQLARYLALFDSGQLLIIHFESEIETNQQQLSARLYEFLGLSPFTPLGLPFREGHPGLDQLSMRLDTSAPDPARHFVEIRRPAPSPLDFLGDFARFRVSAFTDGRPRFASLQWPSAGIRHSRIGWQELRR